jgi:hypothetical protein
MKGGMDEGKINKRGMRDVLMNGGFDDGYEGMRKGLMREEFIREGLIREGMRRAEMMREGLMRERLMREG